MTPGYCDEEAVRLKVDFGELKLEDVRLFVDPTDLSLGSSIKTCEGTLFAVYTTP